MNIIGIIPARYASTRFPGKPLIDIEGKSMIQRVYEQACQAKTISQVIVATDDERIFNAVKLFGGEVMMTSPSHQSGTDRCREVAEKIGDGYEIIINIQGDEPFIAASQIDLLAGCFTGDDIKIGTLIEKITNPNDLFNRNVVKVVIAHSGEVLFFSRAAIPILRNFDEKNWLNYHTFYKHIGTYAYRTEILKEISALKQSSLEKAEALEQLRWLENGYRIKAIVTELESFSIDTPDDLLKIKTNV